MTFKYLGASNLTKTRTRRVLFRQTEWNEKSECIYIVVDSTSLVWFCFLDCRRFSPINPRYKESPGCSYIKERPKVLETIPLRGISSESSKQTGSSNGGVNSSDRIVFSPEQANVDSLEGVIYLC
jgi:hypothetical protein